MNTEVAKLVVERGLIKAALTRFSRYFKESASTVPIKVLQKRLEANIGLYEKYDRVQKDIERAVIDKDSEALHAADRDTFEDTYFNLIAEVESFIENTLPPQQAVRTPTLGEASQSPVFSNAPVTVKLPTIQLPSFDGNYNEWIKFRDTFISLVHESELSEIQKFHYLNSALRGPAARIIQSLGVSGNNYCLAWEALTARYENSTALRKHHTTTLLDLPCIHKPSPSALREFLDDARNHLAALRSLKEPVEHWDTLIIPILSRKLDPQTLREWERGIASLERVTFKNFVSFLEERSMYLEGIASAYAPSPKVESHTVGSGNRRLTRVTAHVASSATKCPACSSNHLLYQCSKFKELTLEDKTRIVQTSQSCYNCLQPGHRVQACTRRHCYVCNKKHHTLLHRDAPYSVNPPIEETESSNIKSPSSCVANIASKSIEQAVLSTAIIYVEDSNGRKHECRALLDSGSQAHFITHDFCKRLGIRYEAITANVAGLGKTLNSIQGKTKVQLISRVTQFRTDLSCLTIDNITEDMPNINLNKSVIPIPSNIKLADPEFHKCRRIDMLIGAGLFWRLLCVGQHKAGTDLLWQKTQLGWVLGGKITWPIAKQSVSRRCYVVTNNELQTQIERFWQVEELESATHTNVNECEDHFQNTTRRNADGRYIVKIPFNKNITTLGTSREQAENRLRALERKFNRQPELHKEYRKFIHEYELLGHMTKIRDADLQSNEPLAYYFPHHAVTKEDSTTTKVRVVFDGSAKTSTGISLNDAQVVGPTIQTDLITILLRFRLHRYVLSADITKMYRQILIDPSQRHLQRILWRSEPKSPFETFELNTVTYGTAAAPFLATRVLHQVGLECAQTYPISSRIIKNDFYVDDLLTGLESIVVLKQVKEELTTVLAESGFELRKWATNCPSILNSSTESHHDKELTVDKDPKTLGLRWSSETDELTFRVLPSPDRRITKRTILSEIAQIFDPLGLIGPIITQAKLIMQQLWQIQAGWDESVSQELSTQWVDFRTELNRVNIFTIPRRVVVTIEYIEVHGFSDASEKAYGACVYLRSRRAPGRWEARLLCSKSRVAPLKSVSLPRLELCGALLLAELVQKVKTAFHCSIHREHYWCDSTITLAWIRGASTRWTTFVANRVAKIQSLTAIDDWAHVRSSENPADVISRGTKPSVLLDNRLWWSGPLWLTDESVYRPASTEDVIEIPEERRKNVALTVGIKGSCEIFTRFSNYTHLLRVIAYCCRFINNTRPLNKPRFDSRTLKTVELRKAQETLIRITQRDTFSHELSLLSSGEQITKKSPLYTLSPFLDSSGVIRVGGRLNNAPIAYNKKHPVVLPSNHPFTNLIVIHEHNRLLHAGCQQVVASLRERFWPISCTRVVKKNLRNCVKCFRVKPPGLQYTMGQLPEARVTPARPFTTCGVDYAGPFITKDRSRSKIRIKAYICIFICFVSKAIHIELATDLSTDAFLNCFKRFISRRGRCRCIVSDNGTNFVGARNKLNELGILLKDHVHNSKIQDFANKEEIEWKFIPPHAPHFGGLWESAVRLTKYHLNRVIGEQILTYEELYTILTQIESCLNSRPLSPLSSDPNDLNPLTPGHLLIGDSLSALPDHDLTETNTNRLNRYQLVQQLFQSFWKRWHLEYIHQLQQRRKWNSSPKYQLTEGTLVIIKEDNQPPLRWSLGRITDLHRGRDGVVRVASVKTAEGHYKRPVTKLCILPMQDDNDMD